MRVLIVEDEAIVAMMAELIVEGLGHTVLGPAPSVESALALIANSGPVDAAILDVNLAGGRVYPVADRLISLHIPFVFTTGSSLDERYRHITVIPKPYNDAAIEAALVLFDKGETSQVHAVG